MHIDDPELTPHVTRIVEAIKEVLRIRGVLITDESCLSDFGPSASDLQKLSEELGVTIDLADWNTNLIVNLAHKLRTGSENRTLS